MADISDINPATPAGSDDPRQGDDQIRQLKTNIQGSFPGFTSNANSVVSTADANQIEYAATTFDATLKGTYDTAVTDTAINASDISDLQDVNNEVTKHHIGVANLGVGPTWAKQPTGWNASITRNSLGNYTFQHDLASTNVIIMAVVLDAGAGNGNWVQIESIAANSFVLEFWSAGGGGALVVDPDAVHIHLMQY